MTEENNKEQDEALEEAAQQTELEALKVTAGAMGIDFHPNIGLSTLRERVNTRIKEVMAESAAIKAEPVAPEPVVAAVATPAQAAANLRNEANRLVRISISCMNPNKTEWDGEVFTVGNKVVGTFRKMVPFNVEWHVPKIILDMIQERKCQVFYKATAPNGKKIIKGKLIKEFAVEVLDDLSHNEIRDLAQRQAMAGGQAA